MKVKIQKWGNSLAIRIPKSFAQHINVAQGSLLELSAVDGNLVAKPVDTEYTLEMLLKDVNEDNLHKEVDTGPPAGKESW